MVKTIIINGSPRAPKSNSKLYAEIFQKYYSGETISFNINKKNHSEICNGIEGCSDILFVFPLYADGIPSTLLNFLKSLETYQIEPKPKVHILINCGFIEPEQNNVALDMMRLFCKQNKYEFCSTLAIGAGEAFLTTPLSFLVKGKINKLAKLIANRKIGHLSVTLPLSKQSFVKASTKYWIKYGEKFGCSKEQMASMKIE